uniref:Uncharacterized protein n=1 Tax=Nothoprocta perdicaria TaxID=30464 RepID=A0A8C6ZI52_NOTPE
LSCPGKHFRVVILLKNIETQRSLHRVLGKGALRGHGARGGACSGAGRGQAGPAQGRGRARAASSAPLPLRRAAAASPSIISASLAPPPRCALIGLARCRFPAVPVSAT